MYFYEGKFKSKYGKILDIIKEEGKTKELVLIEDENKAQHKTLKKYSIVIGEKLEEVKRFIV